MEAWPTLPLQPHYDPGADIIWEQEERAAMRGADDTDDEIEAAIYATEIFVTVEGDMGIRPMTPSAGEAGAQMWYLVGKFNDLEYTLF